MIKGMDISIFIFIILKVDLENIIVFLWWDFGGNYFVLFYERIV